jgi:hypothetical protein
MFPFPFILTQLRLMTIKKDHRLITLKIGTLPTLLVSSIAHSFLFIKTRTLHLEILGRTMFPLQVESCSLCGQH